MDLMQSWRPALTDRHSYRRVPDVGALVGFRGKPYRVAAVRPVPETEWTDRERDWLASHAWCTDEPIFVRLESAGDHPSIRIRIHPGGSSPTWYILPEHYAVCVTCGDLAPCEAHLATLAAREAAAQAEKDMRVIPGTCPACNEPITSRQKTITYPGGNVLNPFDPGPVRFHTRRQCLGGAERYEAAWVAADPSRPRSRLTLTCKGAVIVHGDGSGECYGNIACPGIYARHRYITACYAQSHGCSRECPVEGHPGTRLSGVPDDLWRTQ